MSGTQNISFVWKTQNPGHVNCEDFSAPTRTTGYPIPLDKDKYRWNAFTQFDDYARGNIGRYGYKILDMSPLYYRPDAHPSSADDCLHFCLPGPVLLDLYSIFTLLKTFIKTLS